MSCYLLILFSFDKTTLKNLLVFKSPSTTSKIYLNEYDTDLFITTMCSIGNFLAAQKWIRIDISSD